MDWKSRKSRQRRVRAGVENEENVEMRREENSIGQNITLAVILSSLRPFIAFCRSIDGRID